VSGKLPTPDLDASVLPEPPEPAALPELPPFAIPWVDWESPPDCTDFLEQPGTPSNAMLATSVKPYIYIVFFIGSSPLSELVIR
jgi:hypothetical protein